MSQVDAPYINEEFYVLQISPEDLDALLSDGWRHFGELFFRYSYGVSQRELRIVMPLRIRLEDFAFSKSQRKILKKNRDLQTIIRPAEITDEKQALFDQHKTRFKEGVPFSLYDFLSHDPARVPCETLEICAYENGRLLATSFFDVGEKSVSSIYAIFDPAEPGRSLGIYTMLHEIEYALDSGKDFYYQGYAYKGNSFYDYKKRFRALEKYDWTGFWTNFSED